MPTPSSNHAALALLRADPDAALAKFGFVVSSDVFLTGTGGGPCLLQCEPLSGSVFRLTAKAGVGDFYFPYVNGNPGVGDCVVPGGQPDGCIATTGGMNGCSLQVNQLGTNFHFYHDNNGDGIARLPSPPPGGVVARVDYKDYSGPLDLGRRLAEASFSHTKKVMMSAQYQYFCLSVHAGGRWKVYYSSILEKGTSKMKISFFGNTSWKKSVEYCSFKPTLTPLLTSFADV